MPTPEEKLRELMDEIGLETDDQEDILFHVKARWRPKPAAGTVQAADEGPPPEGPNGGPVSN